MQETIKLYPPERIALEQLKQWIVTHPAEMFCLQQLCRQTGLNRQKLKKGFRLLFGFPPYQFHVRVKMQEAARLLRETLEPVSGIAFQLGYQHVSSFCKEFKRCVGSSPLRYRENATIPLSRIQSQTSYYHHLTA